MHAHQVSSAHITSRLFHMRGDLPTETLRMTAGGGAFAGGGGVYLVVLGIQESLYGRIRCLATEIRMFDCGFKR